MRARLVAAFVATVVALGAGGAVQFARLLPGLEQDSISARFQHRGKQPAPGLLVRPGARNARFGAANLIEAKLTGANLNAITAGVLAGTPH